VSCGARRTVNVTKKTKSMVRKRKKKRQKEGVAKKLFFFFTVVLGRIDHDPNQEGSESRPLDHVNLRKGST
jgi:hypothetical protein